MPRGATDDAIRHPSWTSTATGCSARNSASARSRPISPGDARPAPGTTFFDTRPASPYAAGARRCSAWNRTARPPATWPAAASSGVLTGRPAAAARQPASARTWSTPGSGRPDRGRASWPSAGDAARARDRPAGTARRAGRRHLGHRRRPSSPTSPRPCTAPPRTPSRFTSVAATGTASRSRHGRRDRARYAAPRRAGSPPAASADRSPTPCSCAICCGTRWPPACRCSSTRASANPACASTAPTRSCSPTSSAPPRDSAPTSSCCTATRTTGTRRTSPRCFPHVYADLGRRSPAPGRARRPYWPRSSNCPVRQAAVLQRRARAARAVRGRGAALPRGAGPAGRRAGSAEGAWSAADARGSPGWSASGNARRVYRLRGRAPRRPRLTRAAGCLGSTAA